MNGKCTIELLGMEFRSFHGCLESERREGNRFVVDFRGEADVLKAAASDELSDTQDYGQIYRIIEREMATPSALLEHVASRIAREIEAQMPGISEFSVSVAKQAPPVGGPCAWSRVTVTGGALTKRRGR